MDNYKETLKAFIREMIPNVAREPEGALHFPYTAASAPDAPSYSHTLWDWDSWLTTIALAQAEADSGEKGTVIQYERGCVLNSLSHCTDDGVMPISISPEGPMLRRFPGRGPYEDNMHKPVIAQQAASLVQRDGGNTRWVEPYFAKIEAFLNRYLESHVHKETGLAYWQDDFAVGVDNDPSVYYRPDKSCGSIYLNCLLYRELLAYGYMLEQAGRMADSFVWRARAQDLADAVNEYCWDERDGTYYSVDFALRPVDAQDWLHRGAPRDYPCLLLRIDNWSSFMPLWAGIASAPRAAHMVERYRDERTFNCKGGVRSLSKLEKMYDVRASSNPSNWRGPVWGIANFMVFSGLLKYGYEEDARDLAEKTVKLFGRDLEVNGSLHEYYNPDSGEPVLNHGFENWNFLVLNMIAWLEGRKFVDTF